METILEIYNRIVGEELRPTTEEYRRAMRKGDPEVTARMKRTAFPALMPACVCAGFRRKLYIQHGEEYGQYYEQPAQYGCGYFERAHISSFVSTNF